MQKLSLAFGCMDLRFGFETHHHHHDGEIAEKCLGQKARCSSKAYRNAGFRCFQGSLKIENENCNL